MAMTTRAFRPGRSAGQRKGASVRRVSRLLRPAGVGEGRASRAGAPVWETGPETGFHIGIMGHGVIIRENVLQECQIFHPVRFVNTREGFMAQVPVLKLNDGNATPQLGLGCGRFPTTRRPPASRPHWRPATARSTRLPSMATRPAWARGCALRGSPQGFVRHHQAVERPAWLRRGAARHGREPAQAGPGLCRPVPDPLAGGRQRQVRRCLARHGGDEGGRARPLDQRVNFTIANLRRLVDETGVVPAVNQVELHPGSPSASCAPSMPNRASPPNPGARWARAPSCTTRRWPGSPRATASRRRR